jgi:CubicO group peptidase (beta-lactamase class C family)
MVSRGFSGLVVGVALVWCGVSVAEESEETLPANAPRADGRVADWLVLGPFPNSGPDDSTPADTQRQGYVTDYLTSVGGESRAVLTADTVVSYQHESGETRRNASKRIVAKRSGVVDLRAAYQLGYRVAYGFCYIDSPIKQKLHVLVGANDSVKVWVNGVLEVDSYHEGGRPCRPGSEVITFDAQQGLNKILIKVEDFGGPAWSFLVEVFDEESRAARQKLLEAEGKRKGELSAFQAARLVRTDGGGHIFPPGPLPVLDWDLPEVVEKAVGLFPLEARWFRNAARGGDFRFEPVSQADTPGRYAAIVDGTTSEGVQVRRGLTFWCVPKDWTLPNAELAAYVQALPIVDLRLDNFFNEPYHKQFWRDHIEAMALQDTLGPVGFGDQFEAILLAGLALSRKAARPLNFNQDPMVMDGDFQLALGRQLEGKTGAPALALPRVTTGPPAPMLRVGTPEEAGVSADAAEGIRAVCREWYDDINEWPFTVLVARRGVIVIEEAFGPVEVETPLWTASSAKLIVGLLFAQYVEQGLIDIDQPIGDFLPGFPTQGPKTVTARHCFTHTTGLSGHLVWDGVYNIYLDNIVANGLDYIHPGRRHEYSGTGYDLAGRLMEGAGGKNILRVFHENLLGPLGAKNTSVGDLAGLWYSSSNDMARIGQLLLNRGAYGNREFFSPETLERFLPIDLKTMYPDVDVSWGMGMVWMPEPVTDAGLVEGIPVDATVLGKNVISHNASSGAIFRVDFDKELVIVQMRDQEGERFKEYTHKFFQAIEAGLVD